MNRLKKIKWTYILCLLAVSAVILLTFFVQLNDKTTTTQIYPGAGVTALLDNGSNIEQKVSIKADNVKAFYLYYFADGNYDKEQTKSIDITIKDKENIIYSKKHKLILQQDISLLECKFDKAVDINNDVSITIGISGDDKSKIGFVITQDMGTKSFSIDEKYQSTNLGLDIAMVQKDGFFKFALLMLTFMIIILVSAFILMSVLNFNVEKTFLFIFPMLVIVYMFILPPYIVPDENTHILKAYEVSDIYMGLEESDDGTQMQMRRVDAEYAFETKVNRDLYNRLISSEIFIDNESQEELVYADKTDIVKTKSYYLFSGAGIALGRLLGLSTVPLYMLARLMNVIFFMVVTYFSIKLMPFCKYTILLMTMLPISLQQIVSISYDSILITLSIFAVSLTFNMAYAKKIKPWQIILLAISLIMISICKSFAYFAMLFLPLIILFRRKQFSEKTLKNIKRYIIIGMVAVIVGAVLLLMLVDIPYEPGNNLISWSGTEGYSIPYFWNNPLEAVKLLVNTVYEKADYYFTSMLGGHMGWMQIEIPAVICIVMFLILVFSVIRADGESTEVTTADKNIMLSISTVSILCCVGGMMLQWTPMFLTYIEGVQGRYILPVLLLMLLSIRKLKIVISKNVSQKLVLGMLLMQILSVYAILMYSV